MIAVVLGLSAALCWSLHDLLARRFAPGTGPFRMAFLVVILGAVFLLPPVVYRGSLWSGSMVGIPQAVLLGVFYALAIGSLLKAFSLAPVSIVGPFTAPYPALVVIWGMFNGLTPTFADLSAIAVIIAGTVIVARFGHEHGGINAIQRSQLTTVLACCALASFSFAASIIFGQIAGQSLGAMEATFISRLPAALLLVPLALREKPRGKGMTRGSIVATLVMAVCDVAAVSAINFMGLFPNTEFGSMAISAYGALTVLLATIVLKEQVSAAQWVGIVMVAAGVIYLGYSGSV